MSCTPATVFAWIGTLLINAAFAALISWGATTSWPVGFVLSLVYTALLFFLAGWLHRRYVLPSKVAAGEVAAAGDDEDDDGAEVGGVGLLTSLLYLLAVIAIGVTGAFLPINLIKCGDGTSPYTSPSSAQWTTDTSSFTQDVREWAEGNDYRANRADFAFLPTAGVTLFGGNDGSATAGGDDGPSVPRLWKVDGSNSTGPYVVSDVACPSDFVSVTDDTVCFVGSDQSSVANSITRYCDTSERGVVACTEGDDSVRSVGAVNPSQLLVSNATLWFKANPPRGEGGDKWGTLIYSMDPASMDLTLHSTDTGGNSVDGNKAGSSAGGEQQSCDTAHVNRYMSILGLFVVALPVLLASIVLWVKRGVPSMPVSTYAGLTGAIVFLYLIIQPTSEDGVFELLKWWLPLSAAAWLVALTFLHLTNRMGEATLTWSLNVSSLVFFVGMILLYGVPGRFDDAWRWVLITLTSFLPLILLGIVTDRIFLLLLGAVGILIDVSRLTAAVTDLVGEGLRVPITFVMLAVAGIGLGFLGVMLNRRQERIQKAVSRWADRFLGRWRREDDGDGSGGVGSSTAETGIVVASIA